MIIMYNSLDVANKFMELAKADEMPIQPMKLLKLVYIAHGWYLGFNHKPLITDTIQAWRYGPVIPVLYNIIKRFGSGPVDPLILEMYKEKSIHKKDEDFIKLIWNRYKNSSGLELSTRTHMEGTPWTKAFNEGYNRTIPNDVIEDYYKKNINESKAAD